MVVALIGNGALELASWNGCYSIQEAAGKFSVRTRLGAAGELQHPWSFRSRNAADAFALGLNRHVQETGVLGCEEWTTVSCPAERRVLITVYKEGRARRLTPAKALRNARWAVAAYKAGNW